MSQLSEISQQLNSYFSGRDEVVAAYIFGSWAKGSQRQESDVDIAVLLDRKEEHDLSSLMSTFFVDLSRLIGKNVHLLFLNKASYVVRAQALYYGILVHVKDKQILAEFRMASFSLYTEFAPALHQMQRGLARRIGELYGR